MQYIKYKAKVFDNILKQFKAVLRYLKYFLILDPLLLKKSI